MAFARAFRCVLALVDPFTASGEPRIVEGSCEGTSHAHAAGVGRASATTRSSSSTGTDRRWRSSTTDEKNRVSHRARAFAALRPMLEKVLEERVAQLARL